MLKVKAVKGDLVEMEADALVNPANSYGSMGGGVALALRRAGGDEVESEAIEKGPTPVGEALATSAGALRAKYVIHAPTMKNPAERIGVENVRAAMRAALSKAKELGVPSVAFPGMGTGVGGVDPGDAAQAMAEELKNFSGEDLEVTLIGHDGALYHAFLEAIKDAGL